MYELPSDLSQIAEGYIDFYLKASSRALSMSPKCKIINRNNKIYFKFTGIGKIKTHFIYVEFEGKEDKGIFRVMPPYPMYLLAVTAPFLTIPSFPAYVARDGNKITAILVSNPVKAIDTLTEAMKKKSILSPLDFLLKDTSFEGYLYKLPAGYVAFIEEKPGYGEYYDIIVKHKEDEEEDENVMTPLEFYEKILRYGF